MTPIKQARSGIQPENIQEIIDASQSAKHATLGNQQQYESPQDLAHFLNGLLPSLNPSIAFDPQCATGNAFHGLGYVTRKYGFEIDNRFETSFDSVKRSICNCVKGWEILDDLFPDLRFNCQNANPPFGLRWKLVDGGVIDSTEYTWRKIMERAAEGGFGWFISNHKTIERLGIHNHDRAYLYQKFPVGIWKNCDVEIGVVHWHNSATKPARQSVVYQTLDFAEHAKAMAKVKHFYEMQHVEPDGSSSGDINLAWETIREVVEDEKKSRSPYNFWLDPDGKLKCYLSTRTKVKRKLDRDEVLRISAVNGFHPLALTPDRETRKLMADLVSCGFYSIEPRAQRAIESALTQVQTLACPIMPTTDFESVAYADEEDTLECFDPCGMSFTAGKSYEIETAVYRFTQNFTRKRVHFDELTRSTCTVDHSCTLSGQDRYIGVRDDEGLFHRFMDRPSWENDHDEQMLWKIFKKPEVRTIADVSRELAERNADVLKSCEMLAGFDYYPGQVDYIKRVACKDYGLIAADVGVGKSLMALSLIQIKGPQRALIIAPQGTMRSPEDEDGDDTEYEASQWVQEIRRFAPGLAVFELFSFDDYHRILAANKNDLPPGIYITYYQAFLFNNAREGVPDSWDDARLAQEIRGIVDPESKEDLKKFLPPVPEDAAEPERHWASTVGNEVRGIRCIIEPCLATICCDKFDFIAVDEAHLMCNLGARTTQTLIRLQPKCRYALTATPIPNIVTNLFSLMGWLCVEDWYKYERRNAAWPYAREDIGKFESTFLSEERDITQESMNRAANPDWKGKCAKTSPVISSPARLLKLLKPTMAFISKEACNPKLVPRKIVDIRVPMGIEQSSLYAHFLDRANIPCRHPLIRARKQIAYLRAICADPAGFEYGGPSVRSNFNPKTIAVLELIRDILKKGDQVVFISARVGQTDELQRRLTEIGIPISRIDSTIKAGDHAGQSNLFKSGKSRVHLMGIKCAIGHSYPGCPYMIVGSLEYSYGSKHQAEGRVWRVNSVSPVTIYCVLHKNSIEELMFDIVASKEDAATICLHGRRIPREFKPIEMSEVLAESMANFQHAGVSEYECEAQWPALRDSFQH